jgi:hypothetical protein
LDETHLRPGAERLQVPGLEALHDHGRGLVRPPGLGERVQQPVLQGQADGGVEQGVLGFRVDADGAPPAALGFGEVDHLLKGRDLVAAVVALVAVGHGLLRPQGLDLGQREVAGEPVGHVHAVHLPGGLAVRELGLFGDVGGSAEHRFVAGDQHAVLGGHEVGLDEVGPHLDGEAVGFQRVLGQRAAGAAVADHQGRLAVERPRPLRPGRASCEEPPRQARADGRNRSEVPSLHVRSPVKRRRGAYGLPRPHQACVTGTMPPV